MLKLLLPLLLLAQDGHKEEVRPETRKAIDEAKALESEKAVEALTRIYEKNREDKEHGHDATAALMEIGFLHYKQKDYQEAKDTFKKIATEFPKCGLYGMCQFNVGVILCDNLKNYEEAVEEFQTLIKSGVNDKDETGNLMNPYRNYRYHGWRMTATCRLKMSEFVSVIDASLEARRAYVTHCGTCRAGMESSVAEWIQGAVNRLGYEMKVDLNEVGSAEDWLADLSEDEKKGVKGSRRQTAEYLLEVAKGTKKTESFVVELKTKDGEVSTGGWKKDRMKTLAEALHRSGVWALKVPEGDAAGTLRIRCPKEKIDFSIQVPAGALFDSLQSRIK